MSTESTKKDLVPSDRIQLEGEARDRINRWTDELNQSHKGLRLSKSDLVSYLILSHPESLSTEENQKIRDAYFDQVRFASWILREAKAAQKRGEAIALDDLFGIAFAPPRKSQRKRPKPEALSEDMQQANPPQIEAGTGDGQEGGEMV